MIANKEEQIKIYDCGMSESLLENAKLDNMGKENNNNIAIFRNNHLEIHFCNTRVDKTFLNVKSYAQDGDIVFLSRRLSEQKLMNKIISSDQQTIKYNDKDKEPIKNFDMYMNLIAPHYQVIIEGINYNYIKENMTKFFYTWFIQKYDATRKKVYIGIVNVPLEERDEFKERIYKNANGIKCCLVIKKKLRPTVHLCNNSVDNDFLNFYQFTKQDKILFFSYSFDDKELSDELSKFNNYDIKNQIKDKDPLSNLKQYQDEKFNNYEIFIEGIDFVYISNNEYEILKNFRKLMNPTIYYHLNIINVPIEEEQSFRNKFAPGIIFLPEKHQATKWNDKNKGFKALFTSFK